MIEIALVVGGYLLGGIAPADRLIRRKTGRSARDLGDNPGAGGAWRHAGKAAGAFVALFDIFKAVVPTLSAMLAGFAQPWLTLVAIAPPIGHNWPAFRRMQGGLGLAPATGSLMALAWLQMLPAYAAGGAVARMTGYVPAFALVGFPTGLGLMLAFSVDARVIQAALAVMAVEFIRGAQVEWSKRRRSDDLAVLEVAEHEQPRKDRQPEGQ